MGVQVAAVPAWTVFYLFWDRPGLTPFDFGQPLYWLPPAVFLLLGSVGLLMCAWMTPEQRREPWAFRLCLSSLYGLAPLTWYAFVELVIRLIGDFE